MPRGNNVFDTVHPNLLAAFYKGPTYKSIVFIGSIHGNEPAGLLGMQRLIPAIESLQHQLKYNVFFLKGHPAAIEKGQRYLEHDLNRLWKREHVELLEMPDKAQLVFGQEYASFYALYHLIKDIIEHSKGLVTFIDLHTTSSVSRPFILINDTLVNRTLANKIPAATVLGIEEFLSGPLLSYINEIGHIALGFEGGQHDAPETVDIMEAVIRVILVQRGCIKKGQLPLYEEAYALLEQAAEEKTAPYEVRMRYGIQKGEDFSMKPGFKSFSAVSKGALLAKSDGQDVLAPEAGRIFMPLYQKQGEDGFFLIRKISVIWLILSAFLRRFHTEFLLLMLPGIRRHPGKEDTLSVNLKVAAFLPREIFHLLGYRVKASTEKRLLVTRREVL